MRSTARAPIPNMKGKKSYSFRCQCCEATDFRGAHLERMAKDEMQRARRQIEERSDTATAGNSTLA